MNILHSESIFLGLWLNRIEGELTQIPIFLNPMGKSLTPMPFWPTPKE